MIKYTLPILFLFTSIATSAPPELLTIKYPIEGNRSSMGKAAAIGPNLVLSADHVVRDEVSSLGKVVATDRKFDRVLIEHKNETWNEIRTTPIRPGETLYFEGGTIRVQNDLSFEVTSGRAINGMSGGPIWDSQDRIVSVVSEGEGNGTTRLWGYLNLAEWVNQHRDYEPSSSIESLEDKISRMLKAENPKATKPTLRERIAAYARNGGQPWIENATGTTSLQHLIQEHEWPASALRGLSQRELDLLHGASHTGKILPGKQSRKTTSANTLVFYTGANCPHCDRFRADCLNTLRSKGWNVKTVTATSGAVPRFEYRDTVWTGYNNSSAFYGKLRGAIK